MFTALTCLTAAHDLRLVLLAGLLSFAASLAAIDLFRQASHFTGVRRLAWLATAGAAGGCGVWATHFIAVLAYRPGIPVSYDAVLTSLSLLYSILALALGFGVAALGRSRGRVILGGAVIAAGAGLMHFVGMWALLLPGRIEWSPPLVAASLIWGLLFCSAALQVASRGGARLNGLWSALLLTAAIFGMHFIAMAAAHIVADPTRQIDALAYSSDTIAFGVTGATIAVLALGLFGALTDRRLTRQAAEIDEIKALCANESKRHLLRLAAAMDHLPLGLCMLDAQGKVVVCNANYARTYGLDPASVKPGMTEADIDELRRAAGSLAPRASAAVPPDLAEEAASREAYEEMPDGRVIVVASRALPDGGSLSTHQDITDRLVLDRELRATRVSLVEARERAEGAACEAQSTLSRLHDAIDAIPEGLALFDAQDRYVLWNERYAGIYNIGESLRQGIEFKDAVRSFLAHGIYHEVDRDDEAWHQGRMERHRAGQSVVEQHMADGRWIQISERRTSEGGTVAVHIDITDLKRREASFRLLLENNPIPMWVFEAETLRMLEVNDAAVDLYKYSREQFLSMSILDIRPEEDRAKFLRALKGQDVTEHRGKTWRHVKADGETIDVVIYSRPLDYEGRKAHISAAFDITERKKIEDRVTYLAHHDVLTGLPNRAAFGERLAGAIAEADAKSSGFAVLCLDLDRFKEVNDVFGHIVGDRLLRLVADKLLIAAEDAEIARVGGDEFTLIVSGEPLIERAAQTVEKLRRAVADPFELDGRQMRLGLSIGCALYPDHGDETALLVNADAALYRAKGEGGGKTCFFDAELDSRLRERHALLRDLDHAIARGELQLHYQPQAREDGSIFGFEALLRWRHPTRGFIPPDVFIPVAEQSGLIAGIGEWVLREACREAAAWPNPLNVAVNLSPIQFRTEGLPQLVHAVLLETGLPAHRLELEITEGVLVDDFSRVTGLLRQLKSLGVKIAMDDFGTGYSSLSYLQSFPFDKIKIDRSFVSSLHSNRNSEAIIRAIIGLGCGLNVPLIAEGVETREQLDFLRAAGCGEAQGYLIGRPREIQDYAELVGRKTSPRLSQAAS
jgi:diguanylate cyclase (GGDEF)-like protein/PAS domain S-box-containing protein